MDNNDFRWFIYSTNLFVERKVNALAHTVHTYDRSRQAYTHKHGPPRSVKGLSKLEGLELSAHTERGDSADRQTER